MYNLASELRLVGRRLAQAPLFSLVVVLTLAVGIGANSAIFSVVNGVLLRPLPFDEPERLVGVWHEAPGLGFDLLNQSPAFHYTYRDENRTFEDIGRWDTVSVTVTGLEQPEKVQGLRVTEGLLPLLRVSPVIGRGLSAVDDAPGSPATVLLSYAYWQRSFGGDPAAIGTRIEVNGRPRDIIGVLPQDFRFLSLDAQLVLPFQFNRSELFIGNFSYQAIARLKPGITLEQANADVARMLPLTFEKFPLPPGFTRQMAEEARIGPNLRPLKQDAVGNVGDVLWVLLGTVGLVLLVACANVANLFLVRAEGRQRELAIRAALGAGRGHITRQLLAESVSLGIVGGAVGLLLAYGGLGLLTSMEPGAIPRMEEIAIDPTVVLFTFGVSILAGLFFGMIPVLKYGRAAAVSHLRREGRTSSGSRERNRARAALVVAQIGLALVLLVGSGLMVRTFQALNAVNPGFVDADNVMTLRLSIPEAEIEAPEEVVRTYQQIIERIRQIPGVDSVGLSSSITMDGNNSMDPVFVEDFPTPEGQIPELRRFKWISPEYFATMGNPLVAGRDITWADIESRAPVVVITANLAAEYWDDPNQALGRRIRLPSPESQWREIVGVAGNIYDNGVSEAATPTVFWPLIMEDFWEKGTEIRRNLGYAIRSSRTGTPTFLGELRTAIWSVNPRLPLARVQTLDQIQAASMARTSFTLLMLGIAAGVALLLGVVGIYGVISYGVAQRTREIGIRMALGARQTDVRTLFVRQGLLLTGLGVLLGLIASFGLTRLLSALLFGVRPLDPATYGVVTVSLAAIALLATYVPARQATIVSPVEALRGEG